MWRKFLIYFVNLSLVLSLLVSPLQVNASFIPDNEYLWNSDKEVSENLKAYFKLLLNSAIYSGSLVLSGGLMSIFNTGSQVKNIKEFADFMVDDKGYTEEELSTMITFNNNTKQYNISSELNNSFHEYMNMALQETTGYINISTTKITDLPVELFANKSSYENLAELYEQIGEPFFFGGHSYNNFYFVNRGGYNFIPHYTSNMKDFNTWFSEYENFSTTANNSFFTTCLDRFLSDWSISTIDRFCFLHNDFKSSELCTCMSSTVYLYNFDKKELKQRPSTNGYLGFYFTAPRVYDFPNGFSFLVSAEGETVKVWKSLDSFKQYDIGKQPYYTSQDWNNYDYSQDNSKSYSESFVDNSIKDSNNNTTYNEIVNNYQTGMTEKEVADLVETILKNQKDNSNKPSDNGGGSSGSGSGSGLSDLLGGIASLFDFFASLIGNIISMIANFLTTLIDSLGTFTSIFDGFSEFLSSAFGFIPKEAIAVIISGVTAIVVLAIIKFLKG